MKAMSRGGQQPIERAFQDQTRRSHIFVGDRAQDRRAAHRDAVEHDRLIGPAFASVGDGGSHIFGLAHA
jgi:hypothetical protein